MSILVELNVGPSNFPFLTISQFIFLKSELLFLCCICCICWICCICFLCYNVTYGEVRMNPVRKIFQIIYFLFIANFYYCTFCLTFSNFKDPLIDPKTAKI